MSKYKCRCEWTVSGLALMNLEVWHHPSYLRQFYPLSSTWPMIGHLCVWINSNMKFKGKGGVLFVSTKTWEDLMATKLKFSHRDNCNTHDIYCHMVLNVTMVTFRLPLLMNDWTNYIVMDYGWVHPLVKTLPSFVINLWWNIVMDTWNLDEKTLGK